MTDTFELTILSQNILLSKTHEESGEILPQTERIKTIARAILAMPYRPDIVGIQEAHIENGFNNGVDLARLCGYEMSTWANHNQKATPPVKKQGRKGEFIGLIGVNKAQAKVIELGDKRRALMTEIGGIAFATLHFRAGGSDAISNRLENAHNLIAALEDFDDAVVFGDFNEPRAKFFTPGREYIKQAGYSSVFSLQGKPSPKTYPIGGYKKLDGRHIRWALDDILVRGKRVRPTETGVLTHDSRSLTAGSAYPNALDGTDHNGVWARLKIAPKHD